ncbi:unnamed protein product (macronuclear) [Paramecium tetraurelia]|uniref:Uncharacterized protein n=1 Tax=Paramecium tetraurelia TaxID=5888 RepID=A0C4P7_PARTE|nr:uncharacterized protein GSPATT00006263001 [Paramecium tetraurelia]CAK65764.1 unnamed protein product [Paramecium tetraurelia]|eukprot:XP_001433161.1 hypothetical protein (macronuclear) [Paramecium tetraurelia strain d4-2]
MYFSNKACSFSNAETNTDQNMQFDSKLHVEQMSKMNNTKIRLYCQLAEYEGKLYLSSQQSRPNFNELIFDPSSLGRYKNFVGASSKIANYIKMLDPKIRKEFIVEQKHDDYLKQSSSTKKECERIKALIRQHNAIYTLNLKGVAGIEYSKQITSKKRSPCKLTSISTSRQSESALQEHPKEVDLNRIHATQRGRKVKVKPLKYKQYSELIFNDSPRSVPLQPVRRSQLHQLIVN